MQLLKMYAVYDKKGKRFDTPFFVLDQVFAERKFIMAIENNDSQFNRFKNDFELHFLGVFDVNTGEFVADFSEKSVVVLEGLQIDQGGKE